MMVTSTSITPRGKKNQEGLKKRKSEKKSSEEAKEAVTLVANHGSRIILHQLGNEEALRARTRRPQALGEVQGLIELLTKNVSQGR